MGGGDSRRAFLLRCLMKRGTRPGRWGGRRGRVDRVINCVCQFRRGPSTPCGRRGSPEQPRGPLHLRLLYGDSARQWQIPGRRGPGPGALWISRDTRPRTSRVELGGEEHLQGLASKSARLRHFYFGDRREITSSRRARQARRVRGHQGRHQVHLRLSGRGPVLPHLASPPRPQGERQGGGPPPLTFDVASLGAKSHSASLPLSCASRPPWPPRRAGGAGRADVRKNFRSPGPHNFRPIVRPCPQYPPRHRRPRSQSDRSVLRGPARHASSERAVRGLRLGLGREGGAGAGSTGNQHLPKLLPAPPRPPPARLRGVDVALLLPT